MADRVVSVSLEATVGPYRAAMAQAAVATQQVKRELTDLSAKVKAGGQGFQELGRASLAATAVIGGSMALSVRSAIQFETAFAGVQKTVDGTAEQMAALSKGIREMALEMPTSAVEIAGVAEAAGQLGVERGSVLEFSRTMVQLGETTSLSANDAATSIARLTNIMGTASFDVERLGSTLVELGNNSATTESEILELATRLAAAGNIAGLTEANVLAFASTLTSVGVEAEAGGTALSKVFTSVRDAVLDGGEKLETFASVANMTVDQFRQAFERDAATAIAAFVAGLGNVNAAGQSTTAIFESLELTDQRLMRALLSTASAGDLLARQLDMANGAWTSNIALAEEYEKRLNTTSAQLGIARNAITEVAVAFGEDLLPAVRFLAGALTELLGGFRVVMDAMGPAAPLLATVASGATLAGAGFLLLAPRVAATTAALSGVTIAGVAATSMLRGLLVASGGIGLALTAASAAVAVFGRGSAQAANDAADFAAALEQQASGAQDAVDAMIAKKVVENDLHTLAGELGVATDLVRDAILGEAGAIDELARAAGVASQEIDGQRHFVLEANDAGSKLLNTTMGLSEAFTEEERKAADTASVQDELAAATSDTSVATADATDSIEEFTKALESLLGVAFGVEAAQDTVNQAIVDFAEQVLSAKEAGDQFATSLADSSEQGLRNRAALRGLVEDIFGVAQAMYEQGASAEEVSAMMAAHRQRLIEVVAQLGLNQAEAARYIDVLLQIPGNTHTTVTMDPSQALNAMDQVIVKAGQMNRMLQAARLGAGDPAGFLGGGASGSWGAGPVRSLPALPTLPPVSLPSSSSLVNSGRRAATGGGGGGGGGAADEMKREQDDLARFLEEHFRQRVEIAKNMRALGVQGGEDYLKLLDEQIAGTAAFTDEWVRLMDERREAMRREASLRANHEDRMFAIGEISNEHMLSILDERSAAEQKYSDEWMDVWQERERLADEIADAERDRVEAELKHAKEAAEEARKLAEGRLSDLNSLLDDEARIRRQQEELAEQHHKRMSDIEARFVAEQQQVIDARRRQLAGSMNVEERFVVGWANSVGALTRNAQQQVGVFAEWREQLDAARDRGVSEAVIDLLRLEEGPQALGQLRMFASATEQEIADLNSAVAAKNAQASDTAQEEARQSYTQVGRMLFDLAEKHAAEVEALTEEFLAEQRALTDELALLGTDQGRSFGEAIEAGIRSSIPGIREAAEAARRAMQEAEQARAGLVNTETGRPAWTGPGGEAGSAGKFAPNAVSWRMPDGRVAWYVPGENVDPGNVGALRGYALGTPMVPADGPAYLHAGERVLSAIDNSKLVSAVQAMGSPVIHNHFYVDSKELGFVARQEIQRMNTSTVIAGAH